MDNKSYIKQTLDRYFEGQTSLEEEKALKKYFNQEVIEDDLLLFKPLFVSFEQERQVQLPQGFEEEVMMKIEGQAEHKSNALRISHQARSWIVRVAAVLVFAVGLLWIYQNQLPEREATAAIDWSKYEPDTPEEALEVYKNAMLKLSKALNDGANAAVQNVQRIDEVGQFFD